jgi:uncharacterized protein (UPF0332 family)
MTRFAPQQILHRASISGESLHRNWAEGVAIERRSGRTLEQLKWKVVADRLDMASNFLARGNSLMTYDVGSYRDALSRFYYGTYHCFRAVVFFTSGGDDHQSHSDLPKFIPPDFPNQSIWKNDLKDLRERRNSADYDIYPKSDVAWRSYAEDGQRKCSSAIKASRIYLQQHGCGYV